MNEKEKYLRIYNGLHNQTGKADVIPGRMGGGYGRICWGENMLETLKAWKIGSLLDVGCGYGNFCDAAALFVPRVYGLDIASVATGNIVDNPEITFVDGEAKRLPLEPDAVEWITSFDCLEHCLEEDIDAILDEFDRVASKGFVLSISYAPCERDGMPLHMTVRPESWWIDKLSRYGTVSKEGQVPITGASYLVCRKPVDRRVVCYCAGGLGRRLLALGSAGEFARRTGRSLSLLWLKDDPLCRIGFSSLFSNPIPEITEEELLGLPSCKIYALTKDVADQALISGGRILRQAVKKWGCHTTESLLTDDVEETVVIYAPHHDDKAPGDTGSRFIAQLSPVNAIQDRIRSLASDLGLNQQTLGVHARGTDFGIDLNAYEQLMERVVQQHPNIKFLVCSEDKIYEDKLKQRFHDQVRTRPKSARVRRQDPEKPWALGNIDTCEASVVEDLIDLCLLARTDFRIYHESSAFARSVKMLSKTLVSDPPEPKPKEDSTPTPKSRKPGAIYYFCPETPTASAGIRRLRRHVQVLHSAGYPAYILHEKSGNRLPDGPALPTAFLDRIEPDEQAVFVIPEGMPRIMYQLKDHPGRRMVIALSWHYVFSTLPDGLDWRRFNIERVLVVSPVIERMVAWSMGLPVHRLVSGIDHGRYCCRPEEKQAQIAYIKRKAPQIEKLKSLLASRNPDYCRRIKWLALDGLSEDEYAAHIRRSSIFLSISTTEGFPTSCLEAMAAGAVIAGYDGVGGAEMLKGEGAGRNCILAPNGDYLALAHSLEPLLDDVLRNTMDRWRPVITRALETASAFTFSREADALIDFWQRFGTRTDPGTAGHRSFAADHAGLPSARSTLQTGTCSVEAQ